jgi:hypothetical protein
MRHCYVRSIEHGSQFRHQDIQPTNTNPKLIPRVQRDIIVTDSHFDPRFKVRASDIAWLAEEARRAAAPAYALLEAALGALSEIGPREEPAET